MVELPVTASDQTVWIAPTEIRGIVRPPHRDTGCWVVLNSVIIDTSLEPSDVVIRMGEALRMSEPPSRGEPSMN